MCSILLSLSSMKWKYWCVPPGPYGYKWRRGQDILCPLLLLSHSVVTHSLWPHGRQHARLPCSLPSPGACSNPCSLNWWDHSTNSSSVIPFSSCLQSSPASGSFPMSQLFTSGGQSPGVSASASVLPMNIQDDFLYNWLVWCLCSPRDSKSLLRYHSLKALVLWHSAFFMAQLSHPYMSTGETTALTRRAFVGKVMSLLLRYCPSLPELFFQGAEEISWLQSPSPVILEPEKIVCHCFHCFPIYFPIISPWNDGMDATIFIFWMLSFKPAFSSKGSSQPRDRT